MKEPSATDAGTVPSGNTSTGSFGGTPQKSRLGAASGNNLSAATEVKRGGGTRPIPQSLLRNTAATAAKSVRTKEE